MKPLPPLKNKLLPNSQPFLETVRQHRLADGFFVGTITDEC